MINEIEKEEGVALLRDNYIGRLAFVSFQRPYVLPITYFFDIEEKCILSYSGEGHKIDAMRKNTAVVLQVDNIESIQNWKSVQVHGEFEELHGSTAKLYLHKFAEGVQETVHRTKESNVRFIQDFSNRLQQKQNPIIFRISISDIIGKSRNLE